MMRTRGTGLHTLVGAYVMDAVPSRDRADFERHLQGCEQCGDDVRGLREAAAKLAGAVAVTPRPELREQTLQAALRLRQLPPVVDSEQRRGLALRLRAALGTLWSRAVGHRTWPARAALAGCLVLVLAAVAAGVHMSSMASRISADQRRDDAIAAIVGAHDEVTLTAQVITGGTATVVMSHQADALVFVGNGLSRLPASKAYELWLMGPAGYRSAGMLPPARGGMTGPMVVRHLRPGDKLGLTVEPAAGSSQPTSAPIVMVTLDT
jgi:Anti-sigma-K factor rskA/Putative zinc-finger